MKKENLLMMSKITSKPHGPHVLETTSAQYGKKRRPYREHQCGTSKITSECQVRELLQL